MVLQWKRDPGREAVSGRRTGKLEYGRKAKCLQLPRRSALSAVKLSVHTDPVQTGGESLLWALSDIYVVGEPLPPSQLKQAKAHTRRLLLMPPPSAQDPKCPCLWALVSNLYPTPHYSRPLVQAGAMGNPTNKNNRNS